MITFFDVIFYVFVFFSVYVQVFFLVTFLENRRKILTRTEDVVLDGHKEVTIVVPCWNEAKTVAKTVESLLGLNYPQNKLKIFLIDDGSTDNTWEVIQKFKTYPNIFLFQKENGGKFTALNLGLDKSTSEFFGCLDADSFAHPDSLSRLMSIFEKDKKLMAVIPSVVVENTQTILQKVQKAEYDMGVYFKKMLSFLGGINVTPGPLTIFRKEVFDIVGPYQHGHNTEDMEITYRMQKNHLKIEHCHDAYVYTNTPATVNKLYRQRLRWVYGFINNTIDYRDLLLKRKYGNFSMFTLPMGVITIFSVAYLFGRIVFNFFNFVYSKIIDWQIVGWNFYWKMPQLDFFFFSPRSATFLVVVIYGLVIFSMLFGRKIVENKWTISPYMFYFFPIFAILSPFWLLRAMFNTVLKRKPSWR